MWPFNRKEPVEDSNLPEEVKEYYEAERREHIGVAWLLAFVTLVVTVAIIVGLFTGGRWAYHKIANKDTTSQTATNTKPQPKKSSSTVTNSTATAASTGQSGSQIPVTNKPSTTTPSTTSSSATTSTPTTATSQTTNQSLANTGPGNTVALFIGVTVVATVGHVIYSRRKLKSGQRSAYSS